MLIFQNVWFLVLVATIAFAIDVYLKKPGSTHGWRGLIRAISEMIGVGCVAAAPIFGNGADLKTTMMFVGAVGVARIIMAIHPPAHER